MPHQTTLAPRPLHIGPQGRIVISAEYRRALGVEAGDTLVLWLENDRLVLRRRQAVEDELWGLMAGVKGSLARSSSWSAERKRNVKIRADTTRVLDASAVLAYLQQEPGMEAVRNALQAGSIMSTVNLAEVCAKLKGRGVEPRPIIERLKALGLDTTVFSEEDAMLSGEIISTTQPLGLSLGDRACLALCRRLGAVALIAEKAWARLELGFEVRLIR